MCGTGTDTITDFNITQGDTTTENDCEIIKYSSNTESNSISPQQQQQQSGVKSGNINSEGIIGNTNTTTTKEEEKL